MIDRSDITPELLRQLLDYDPETGILTWKWRDLSWFSVERIGKTWNSRWAGTKAFQYVNPFGYHQGSVLGRQFIAHQIIWLMCHGNWALNDIDHINGIRTDNRILNLREVPHHINLRNSRRHLDNTSGFTGVSFIKRLGKWRARLHHAGKELHLGLFDTAEEGYIARKKIEMNYGYHPNHGRDDPSTAPQPSRTP